MHKPQYWVFDDRAAWIVSCSGLHLYPLLPEAAHTEVGRMLKYESSDGSEEVQFEDIFFTLPCYRGLGKDV